MTTSRIGSSEGAGDTPPCLICGAVHSALEACRPVGARSGGSTPPVSATPKPVARPTSFQTLVGISLGNFRIVKLLGQGGMGSVYLGEHQVIGSRVAVKFLHPHLAADASLVERFFAEARAANLAGHENIVSIYDLNLYPPNLYYLVMEYLEGQTLTSLASASRFDPAVAIPILAQACDGLQAAHQVGVIHRDLKPENVFLVKRDSNPHFVKLVDFGIAKLNSAGTGLTSAGLAVGTPEYMAPEQWTSDAVDGRADLYALGIIGYCLATGRLPFREESALAYWTAHKDKQPVPPSQLNPEVSKAYEAVIAKAMAKRAEDRFQTALEMKAALLDALSPGARPVPPPRPPTPVPQSPRHAATYQVVIAWDGAERALESVDLSRGGMFVNAEAPLPPVFSRVQATISHAEGELTCQAEVVRHVLGDQAKAWGMSPGFALSFVETTERFRRRLERLLAGKPFQETPRPTSLGDDPSVTPLLDFYRKRVSGDHYALLGVGHDAECSEIRHRARLALQELESAKARRLSPKQLEQVDAAIERVTAAQAELGSPARRAEYDSMRGNFRGVARCLSAGLPLSKLEELRKAWLARNPRNETMARLQMVSAHALEGTGDLGQALLMLETALGLDPLSLELHQRYWSLKRKKAGATGGKAS